MNNNFKKLLPLCISAAILSGCGGGDGYTETNVPPDFTAVEGAGVKGPLAFATVNAYMPDYSQDNLQGELLGSGTTDSAAAIQDLIIDANYTGPMVLEFLVTSETVDISSNMAPEFERLVTYVTETQRTQIESLYASLLTTMAVDLALANTDTSVTQEVFETALSDAESQIKTNLGFGLPDFVNIFTTPPLLTEDTTSEDAMALVTVYRQTNELVAALTLELNDQSSTSQTPDELLQALVEDLTDGDLDGEGSSGAVSTLQTFTEDFATTVSAIDVDTLMIPGTSTLISDIEAVIAAEASAAGLDVDTTALTDGSVDIPVVTIDGGDPTPERRLDLYVDALLDGYDIGSYNPESSVTLSEEAVDGRGMVFTMDKASAVGNAFFTSTSGSFDMSSWSAIGELAMDIRVNSMADGAELLIKMDSGWPNVSDTNVTLGAVGEWFEFRINVSELVANGNSIEPGMVDLLAVVNPVVFEPTGVMNVSFDNVRFVENEDEDSTAGDDSAGDDSTGDDSTGDDSTGDDSTGDDSTGDDSTGDDSTGDDSTGDDSTGDDSTGDDTAGSVLGAPPVFTVFEDETTVGLEIDSYNPDSVVTTEVVAEGDRGNILNMVKTGATGNVFFNVTDGPLDMTDWLAAGDLVVDIRVNNNDDNSQLLVKMDSGWPNLSDTVATLGAVGEWVEFRISVADLADNGNSIDPSGTLNIASVANPVVFEPSGPMDLSFDNIRFEGGVASDDSGSDDDVAADVGAPPLFVVYEDATTEGLVLDSYNPDSAVTLSEVEIDGRGTVLNMLKTGANGNAFFNVTAGPLDMTEWLDGGQLVIDILVNNNDSNSDLLIKMDTGWPNLSDTVATLGAVGEWYEFRIDVADLADNGNSIDPSGTLNIASVANPVVFEPNGPMDVSFDNIRFEMPADDVAIGTPPLFDIFGVDVGAGLQVDSYNPDTSVSYEVVSEDSGSVFSVVKTTANGNIFFNLIDGPIDMSAWATGGELVMDIRVDNNDSNSDLLIKIDSGWPNLSDTVATLGAVGEWFEFRMDVADLADNGNSIDPSGTLNIASVANPVVFEPNGPMEFSVANIRFEHDSYDGSDDSGSSDGSGDGSSDDGSSDDGSSGDGSSGDGSDDGSSDDGSSSDTVTTVTKSEHWTLVWSDEFDGTAIDDTKWEHETNCWGGGNNEQQCYTDRAENSYVQDGMLNIVARRENFTGNNGSDGVSGVDVTLPYTSARLRTKGKQEWTFGRFEVHAKLPYGQGTWPAAWMLPTDSVYGGWASGGEIDIVETVNLKVDGERHLYGTIHYGGAWPNNESTGQPYELPDDANPADDFHTYAVEWEEGEIRWYVDDIHYGTTTSDGWYSQYTEDGVLVNGPVGAPFDAQQQFHMLLNFAVGGSWAGSVNQTGIDESVFPQTMQVDWVRVYECSVSPSTGAGCSAIHPDTPVLEGNPAPDISGEGSIAQPPLYTVFADEAASELGLGSYNPDGAVTITTPEETDRGTIINVNKTGATGNAFFNFTDGPVDMSAWAANGEIVLDIKVNSSTDDSQLLLKIDSGWPNLSDVAVPVAAEGEWFEFRIGVAALAENGNSIDPSGTVNLASVANAIVFEPTGVMDVSFDNVRFVEVDSPAGDPNDGDFGQPPLFTIFTDTPASGVGIDAYNPENLVTLDVVEETGRGNVFTMVKTGATGNAYFTLTDGATDMSAWANGGELVMDIRVDNNDSDSDLLIKIDSGWPNVSDTVATLGAVGEWLEVRIDVADLADNGNSIDPSGTVNLGAVINPVVFEPTGAMSISVDNIRFVLSEN